jgi:hypothetical protein
VILSLLANFALVFNAPTWRHAQTLVIGAILCPGKRTVTAALQVMGLAQETNFSKYHRVLNKSKWDSWLLVKILLGLLIRLVPRSCHILIAMDETIERRKGKKITSKGCYRDSCRSTKSLVVRCFGLKWQCAALLIKFPWNDRYWAMPFMTVLCIAKTYDSKIHGYNIIIMSNKSTKLAAATLGYYKNSLYYVDTSTNTNLALDEKLAPKLLKGIKTNITANKNLTIVKQNIQQLGKKDMSALTAICGIRKIPHRSSVDYALLMMVKISRHLKRPWIFVGDGGFASVNLGLACRRRKVSLISRLRKDAALYEPVSEIASGKRGRKPQKGARAKSLNELIKQSDLNWQEQEITWYRGIKKTVALYSGTNLWYTAGNKPLPIRWVLVKDLESGNIESFFSSNQDLLPAQIVEYFVLRWNLETTFEETRAHLGVETQRQWSKNAINRTTPVLLGLYSLVCLIAYKLASSSKIPVLNTAWYEKNNQATFSDVMRFVKQAIRRKKFINKSWIHDDMVQIPLSEFEDLINQGFMAA